MRTPDGDRTRATAFTLVFCAFAGAAIAAPPDWMAELAARLFERVYTEAGPECPAGLERIGDASSAVCATYDRGFERLEQTLKQFDDRPNRTITRTTPRGPGLPPSRTTSRIFTLHRNWRKQGALVFRDWLEDEDLVVLAFDESRGLLAVLPKDSCLEPQVRAREGLHLGDEDGFVEAEALENPLPPPPPRAPDGLRKGGDAVVQAVVDRFGNVGETCVMHSRPGGFGKRALKAIDRWRFSPATVDGSPVDSVVTLAFRWRQHRWEYERFAHPVRH